MTPPTPPAVRAAAEVCAKAAPEWMQVVISGAFKAGAAWAFEEAAKLAEDWAAGAGYLNDAEGRPIDPKQDHETAGHDIADAIRAAAGPAGG